MYWNANKNQIISTVVGAGAMVLTTALATVTGGTAMFVIGMGTGAFQSGLDSYLNQRNSGFAVDWGTVGKETLKGGVLSGIAGGVGGVMANVTKPLSFCGKGAMEIAGDVLEHWAVGTVGDAGTTMLTTYVSDRMDGKSPQEAFQNVMSSADDILVDSMWTSAAGTLVDSVTAPKCFVAGTMITTISGLKAIEQIQAGDLVLAANEETGEVAYKEVVRTFVNTTDEITHVTIENAEGEQETIDSTPEHPFYVEGLGWVEASALHPGMTIWFANGTKGTVEDISNEGLEEPVTVYNFEVKDFHTYFVGEYGVLVHNVCDPDGVIRDGSHLEDGKLQPNVTYQTGENGYYYTTNSDGLISSAYTDNLQRKTHDGRLSHNPNTYDKADGDHAGHLFGDRFGGSPELDNLVSQARSVNLSEFKVIENEWANALANNQKVTVNIQIGYGATARPESFKVSYTIDGIPFTKTITQ